VALSPFEEIISFALDKEKEAMLFYEDLSGKAEDPVMKESLLSMADEEQKHARLLRGLTPKDLMLGPGTAGQDLKIGDYLVEVKPSKNLSYQDLLIIGIKREERSLALYSDLEKRAADAATRSLFSLLRGEELKHKTRLEREYEERILWNP
jgi:rubrerythrin